MSPGFYKQLFLCSASGFLSRSADSFCSGQPQWLHWGNAVCAGCVWLCKIWMLCQINWAQRASYLCFHVLCVCLFSLSDVQSWKLCVGDAVWLRNQVVAPVTEELVFRGAMLPMLVPCTGPTGAILTAPLFFGVGMWKAFSDWNKSYLHAFYIILNYNATLEGLLPSISPPSVTPTICMSPFTALMNLLCNLPS